MSEVKQALLCSEPEGAKVWTYARQGRHRHIKGFHVVLVWLSYSGKTLPQVITTTCE